MPANRLATVRACLRQLDLEPGARWGDVRRGYRTLAQVWHPDRFPQGSELHRAAGERLKEITSAYRWLREHRDLLDELEPLATEPQEEEQDEASDEPERERSRWSFGRGAAFRPRRAPKPNRPGKPRPPPSSAPVYASRRAWILLVALIGGAALVMNEAGFTILPTDPPEEPRPTRPVDVFVQAGRVSVQQSPYDGSPTVGVVSAGQQVRVTDTYEGWRRVVSPEDSTQTLGWIAADGVGEVEPEPRPAPPRSDEPPELEIVQPDPAPAATFESPELRAADVLSVDPPREHEPRWGDDYWGLQRRADEILDLPTEAWTRIGHWAGEDPTYTEPFHPASAEWRLAWRAIGSGTASLQLYEAESRSLLDIYELKATDSTAYVVREGAGSYYLQVWPTGALSWRIAAEARP